MLKKLKSINHKGRKGNTQKSQRAEIQYFTFVNFAPSLCTLQLKKTFSTAPRGAIHGEIPERTPL